MPTTGQDPTGGATLGSGPAGGATLGSGPAGGATLSSGQAFHSFGDNPAGSCGAACKWWYAQQQVPLNFENAKWAMRSATAAVVAGVGSARFPGSKYVAGQIGVGGAYLSEKVGQQPGNTYLNYFLTTYGDSTAAYAKSPGNNMQ